MGFLDVTFLVGAVAGPVVALTCCAIVLTTTRRRGVVVPVVVLTASVAVAFAVFWFFWGEGFEAADAVAEVPHGVRVAQDVSSVVGAAATLVLVMMTAAVLVRSRRG
ncbi:hypothetical protein [Nocardioides aurantiacus]|uniref:Uncharacterized protein n=1 Tax=Nocardioides aurantiacus TaxID=86796 RepID=A0A3N2CTN2_9ACTN|nr:hypothetical protein [Nocardioides aurantiacus]ROR90893.1 hypothetical protein EDD33_1742 [Nocardioides aurantiacus]